ncbi:small acid-soluble spore protein (thioredoxin-like protein) [Salirhabdus euzebyi]|uniref:Small, acid-soluble spore protein Tlp n=1 Tax=Salirhabdus euzebyi TaxID=394506 RepID=A0A841Q2M0_9BACI|nr:small acid-soluble spore protein Tlp [Salirhabdus euzebyi]MBB6452805.1 small acid-soluble spore protein (thioredoxin-like protein) [Salirhabdus euzebyi]
MPNHHSKPNPDNRADNVEKLQEMVHNTIENMEEAEEIAHLTSDKDKANLQAKNERRRESIKAMRAEIKDEYRHQH